MTIDCPHASSATDVPAPADVCQQCVDAGDRWVSLRQCLVCGETACCDDSKNRHARGHWKATDHTLIRSAAPNDAWTFCFACSRVFG